MKLLIGDQEIEFSNDELDYMFIDEGSEAEVFQYKDEVLKLYKDFCRKYRLSEEEASALINIPTKRILLPKKIIKIPDSLDFKGYTTQFIKTCSRSVIPNMKMDHFLDELEVLESDMKLLADNDVDVDDFNLENMLYDGCMYFCDPGSFTFRRGSRDGSIYRNNISQLNTFVLNDLFGMVKVSKVKRQAYNINYDDSERLSWQIRDNTVPGETIKQHIRRMTR